MVDRRRGPRFLRFARVGTPVLVTASDSMYRGLSGTIVQPDVRRTVLLDGYNRRRLAAGDVLVEQKCGSLFVVPAYVLELERT